MGLLFAAGELIKIFARYFSNCEHVLCSLNVGRC